MHCVGSLDEVVHVWLNSLQRVSTYLLFGLFNLARCTVKYFNHQSPERVRAGMPSIRNPASRDIISASVELCGTEGCFLDIQLIATYVEMHRTPPDVDFESSRSPAKSES